MNEGGWAEAATTVRRYHALSKHNPRQYAPGPGGLDWANQPNPFRRFKGSAVVPLPLVSGEGMLAYDHLFRPAEGSGSPLDGPSLGLFFELGLGLSAWKEYGSSRWALRNNPSSGNLHPTEGYLVLPTDVDAELFAGVYHYLPHEHALERRCRFAGDVLATIVSTVAPGGTLVGLSSVHWREAWKYGERAFRYCQHDAGHAIASLRLAARVLGWRLRVLPSPSDALVAALLGLDRRDDFAGAEPEHPGALMLLDPTGRIAADLDLGEELAAVLGRAEWYGRANLLSPAHLPWRAMQSVAEAAAKPESRYAAGRHTQPPFAPAALADVATVPSADAAGIIRQRRSAVAMDSRTRITRASFFRMLARTMPDPGRPPWDAWPWPATVLLGLFVHRVDGLAPGLYLLARAPERLASFRETASGDWLAWQPVEDCPLPLWALMPGADLQDTAALISCNQEIAADGAFSLGMLADLDRALVEDGPWAYRRLFWECGVIGQVLYLEAEALGVRATGIGCFFDDLMHQVLGFADGMGAWQSLYHFTVGGPLEDTRLRTSPAYAHLER